ncbi:MULTISPECIES: hypothetical protein [unclassified Rhizobium]|uniref:hypothetical protein n=1 Tax=unclassified Rhizobium TaxID=2613769 RepID=UPI000CDF3872|nr:MULTISPECIES: hypothetical protein [Rhizobium]AVA22175.1 hypothetical protein NXC24_CH02540 [Rhizobium sp. NXC24]UWU19623.1 hypothetical protein N2601_09875 [Rhizobium tropici]
MSTFVNSLKKQNEFLQGEVERFASAVDDLAGQLAQARAQLEAKQRVGVASERSEMEPADDTTMIAPPDETA